jgi:hypothetical protein
MSVGAKLNETRPRPWAYKGDVAICSAKLCWKNDVPEYAIPALTWLWKFRDQFPAAKDIRELYLSLPFGSVLCVVEKTECVPSIEFQEPLWKHRSLSVQEFDLGDYTPGRFVYPTRNRRRLKTPVPVIGRQGFFNLPPDVEAKVLAQI